MLEILKILGNTPVPTLLVVAGLFFIFVAIGGQVGAKIVTDRVRPRTAGIVGVLLLVVGIAMFRAPGTDDGDEVQGKPYGPPPGSPEPGHLDKARIREEIERNEEEQRRLMEPHDPIPPEEWDERRQRFEQLERRNAQLRRQLD